MNKKFTITVVAVFTTALILIGNTASASVISYWEFNGGPADALVTSATDSVGSHNATAGNGNEILRYRSDIPSVPNDSHGPNQFSIEFDGTDDYLQTSTHTDFEPTAGFTMEAFFKTDEVGNRDIICANDYNGSQDLELTDSGTLAGKVRTAAGWISLESSNTVQTSTWYFAAVTYDKATGKAKLYLGEPGNIAEVDSGSVTAGSGLVYYPAGGYIEIGGLRSGTVLQFDGLIDNVRYSGHAMDKDDLLGVPEPSTLLLAVIGLLFGLGLYARRRWK